MKRLRIAFSWLHIFHKRLFLRPSFLVLLLLIPLIGALLGLVAGMDSGVLKVHLATEEENEKVSQIFETLMGSEDVLQYVISDPETAEKAVKSGKADAAWIFRKDFDKLSAKFAKKQVSRNSLVKVIQREDEVTLMLAREKLCGVIYPYVSYELYLAYVEDEIIEGVDEAVLKEYYDSVMPGGEDLFDIAYADGGDASDSGTQYLTAPLRGILSVMVLLTGLAVSMFYKLDEEKGLFVRVPKKYQLLFSLGYHLAPIVDVGAVLVFSLYFAGVTVNIYREIGVMLLFALASALFCIAIERLCPKLGVLCAITPIMIIGMIVVCPVFFNFGFLRPLQVLCPPYYYLNGVFNITIVWQMLVYIAVLLVFNAVVFALSPEKRSFD